MTTRGKKKPEKSNNVLVIAATPEEAGKATAAAMMRPEVQAAFSIKQFEADQEASLMDYVAAMTDQAEAVKKGGMGRAEEMLITQAHTLNELFNNMARRAHKQDYLSQFETYMRVALKAQNQCRMTLESLATIKNPPIVYAKQANVTTGPQQVNNGIPANSQAIAHAEENRNRANELLSSEVQHGEALDYGRTGTASGTDKVLATLDEIDRPAKS